MLLLLLVGLSAFALIPVTEGFRIIPVEQGKAVWPSSGPKAREAIYQLDGQWALERTGETAVWQQVPAVAWDQGSGTYSLALFVEDASTGFEMHTTNAGTSYLLLVNGKLAGTSGTYGETADTARASAATKVHQIQLQEGWNTMEFRVSNFIHPRAGLWEHVRIGRDDHLSTWHNRRVATDLIMFGLLLMFVLMHLMLGWHSKRRSFYLGFALGALAAAVGGLVRNQFALFALIPDLPYLLVKQLQFISLFLAGGWFAGAFRDQLDAPRTARIIIWFRRFCFVLSGVAVVLPYRLAYPLAIWFFPLMLLVMGLLLYHRIEYLFQGQPEDGRRWEVVKLLADCALTYGMIHDFLNIVRATYELQVLPYTVSIYVGLYSMVLSRDFIRAMQRNEEAKHHIMAAWEQARRTLASDLHDGVIQLTHGLEYLVEGVLLAGTHDVHALGKIKDTARAISKELRETLDDLNPTRIGDGGFLQAVERLAERIRETYGIVVNVYVDLAYEDIPILQQNHLYYIVSESVSNAIRHAQASVIEISCAREADAVLLSILNDGMKNGAPPEPKPGHGLDIIRYRTEVLGGTCRISTTDEGCFLIEVHMKGAAGCGIGSAG